MACSLRRLVIAQRGILLQRLADARDVAVAEDAEAAGKEGLRCPVAFDVLPVRNFTRACAMVSRSVWLFMRWLIVSRSVQSSPPRGSTNAITSASVGMKLAQPCCVTTMAPQALPRRAAFRQPQPWRWP